MYNLPVLLNYLGYDWILFYSANSFLKSNSYLEPLSLALEVEKWSLVQPLLSSSYIGYGISSLEQVCSSVNNNTSLFILVPNRRVCSIALNRPISLRCSYDCMIREDTRCVLIFFTPLVSGCSWSNFESCELVTAKCKATNIVHKRIKWHGLLKNSHASK